MYLRFAASLAASVVAMYALSFSEIDAFAHFHLSLSTFYMTLMMVSAMGLIMLTTMGSMIARGAMRIGLYALFAAALAGAFVMGREQALVGDEAFLRSMIPHHSRAILVCQESDLSNPDVIELCDGIIRTQREEITQMERILDEGT